MVKINLVLTLQQVDVMLEALNDKASALFRELHMQEQSQDMDLAERDDMIRKEYIVSELLSIIRELKADE